MNTQHVTTPTVAQRIGAIVPGLAVAVAIAIVATVIGRFLPLVGSAVPGIVIGVVLGILLRPGARLRPGIQFASKFVLQLAVVLLGAQLTIGEAARVGLESLPVMLGTLIVCLLAAWLLGKALGVIGDVRTLIGVGTGICGASAIAAVAPVIGAVSADVAYAVSTIFLFNITAVIVFPVVGHLLGMSQHAFGLFAGTAVNDTSSVVAAATTYGSSAANYAVVVKLVRTLMIIPISIGLAALVGRRERARELAAAAHAESGRRDAPEPLQDAAPAPARMSVRRVFRLVPWFLIGFVIMAIVSSLGLFPAPARSALSTTSVFLISVALSAIGLSTDVGALRRAGARPLVLGALLWLVVASTSLALQWATGTI